MKWITDEDEIVSNDRVQAVTQQVFGSLLHRFCPQGFTELTFGVSGKFDDHRRAEDLCSISDLVGGAVAESLTGLGEALPRFGGLVAPFFTRHSTKTDLILRWTSLLDGPLKFRLLVVRPTVDGHGLDISFIEPDPNANRLPDFRLWTPPDKGWRNSLRSWRREFLAKMMRPKGG